MDARAFKDRVYDTFADVAKALASPKRIELLDLLCQTERPVEWLAAATGMSVANTSQHLQVLKRARLVDGRREGTFVHYRASTDAVVRLVQALRHVAEQRDAEVDRIVQSYLGDRAGLEAVPMDALALRLAQGDVIVVDVRPHEEFAAGHLPGAISAPLDALDALEVPPGQPVVAYCRGPYCVLADEAVRRLRERGLDARRLAVGLPEWRAAGLPVTT